MPVLFSLLLALHLLLAVLLIVIILFQQGKGATAGAAFGSGASSTVFGARGSASFLSRATAVLATLFLVNSLVLGHLYGERVDAPSLLDSVAVEDAGASAVNPVVSLPEEVPVAPAGSNDLPPIPTSD